MKKRYSFFRISIALIAVAQVLLYQCNIPATDFIQPVPVALEASSISSTGFLASWKPVLGSTRYVVDVSTDPQFSSYVSGYQSHEMDSTSLLVTGLVAEVQYYYRVRAQKNNTISGNSNVITLTTAALVAPVATAATTKKVFQFTANWTPVAEAASYLLEVATDSGFVNILTKYNSVEVVNDSLVIEDLDYQTTYYYRVKAKRLEKTSGYSNIVEVVPCISANCKLSKITTGFGEVVQFQYDDVGNLISIANDYAGVCKIAYDNGGSIPTSVEEYDNNDQLLVRDELIYDANGLLQSINLFDGDGNSSGVKDYLYNDKQQLIGFRQYDDAARTSLNTYQDYEIDVKGNILKILKKDGSQAAQFRYDDKFNPKMLIPQTLRQFILDDFTGYYFQPYLRLNNPLYAQGTFNPVFDEEEVFIYDINIRDVAFARKGFYKLTYEFTGCDF